MKLRAVLLVPLLMAACDRQPTIVHGNSTTDVELSNISAHTNQTDGMDQGNAMMSSPTLGQQMDARNQPPKSQ